MIVLVEEEKRIQKWNDLGVKDNSIKKEEGIKREKRVHRTST